MKNRFTLTIETDNAAFDDAPASEIARILRQLANDMEQDGAPPSRFLFDANGNRVGVVDVYQENPARCSS